MIGRTETKLCPECGKLFLSLRQHGKLYCAPECAKLAKKRQNVAYERKIKRHTYRYRKKKVDPNQLALDLK